MPNPAWTASDGASDPSTTLPESDSMANTTVSSSTTDETTVTTDPTVTEPTSGTDSTDPTTTSTTSTSTMSTSTTTMSTSTSTGGPVCEEDDTRALNLELELSQDPAPFVEPTWPDCGEPSFFIGVMNLNDGLKVSGNGDVCQGGEPEGWLSVTGKYPALGGPYEPQGLCTRIYLHYVEDAEAESCRFAAYQIFQGPNLPEGEGPLFAAGMGVWGLEKIDGLKDYTPTGLVDDCVVEPSLCEEPEGTKVLEWGQFVEPAAVAESGMPEPCGPDSSFDCYNLRAHRYEGDGEESCELQLDWIIKKKE